MYSELMWSCSPHSTKPSQEFESGNSTRCLLQQHYEDDHSDMDGKYMALISNVLVCKLNYNRFYDPTNSILKHLYMLAKNSSRRNVCMSLCATHLSSMNCIKSLSFTLDCINVTVSDKYIYHIATSYKSYNVLHSNSKVMQCIAICILHK